jgi:YfiH family protein
MVNERPVLVSEPRLIAGRVRGGITTRRGFPSATAPSHDDPARAEGRRILARLTGSSETHMAWLRQVHGAGVIQVDRGGLAGSADGLVTTRAGLALLVAVADCGPVLLWDSTNEVIAAAHAGWRGTVAGIAEATIDAMCVAGAGREQIQAWIGPCIGVEAFEVGEEVASQFPDPCVDRSRTKPHVDLSLAIRERLLAAGVGADRIRTAGQCTFEIADRYWSYRRDGGICGRQFAWIVRSA